MTAAPSLAPPPDIIVCTPRERTTVRVRSAFSRRQARVHVVRTAGALARAFRTRLVDAAIIDLGVPAPEEAWQAATLARDYPSAPFFGLTALRTTDAGVLARCAELDLVDVLIDGIDDAALAALVLPATFRARFAGALAAAPERLRLTSELQRRAWACIVAHGGRPVRTDAIAGAVGLSREHLSRAFARDSAPTLKRAIDLARLLAAAELAKNPGLDLADVAAVLGFASPSHLSATVRRLLDLRSASLARLRAADLVARFVSAGRPGRLAPRS